MKAAHDDLQAQVTLTHQGLTVSLAGLISAPALAAATEAAATAAAPADIPAAALAAALQPLVSAAPELLGQALQALRQSRDEWACAVLQQTGTQGNPSAAAWILSATQERAMAHEVPA